MQDVRDYAKKHGINLTLHRNDTITIRYSMKYQGGDLNDFLKRFQRPIRGVLKRLNAVYEPSTKNWVHSSWPELTFRCTVKKFEKEKVS